MANGNKSNKVKKKPDTTKRGGQNTNNSRKQSFTRSSDPIVTIAKEQIKTKILKLTEKSVNKELKLTDSSIGSAQKTELHNHTNNVSVFDQIQQIDESSAADGVNVNVNSDEELDFLDDVNDSENEQSKVEDNTTRAESATQSDLQGNPHIEKLLNKMVEECIERELAKRLGETCKSTILTQSQEGIMDGKNMITWEPGN